MSRIKRFEGWVDGVGPDDDRTVGLVFATTPGLPSFGYLILLLSMFSKADQAILRSCRTAKVEGRICPRSVRLRIVEHS